MRDYLKLNPVQRSLFMAGVRKLIVDLHARRFRKGLRIKAVQGYTGVYEMTWAPDGRATFAYGPEVRSGDPHIIWRRVGGHDIFDSP